MSTDKPTLDWLRGNVAAVLRAGLSVALDFPASTRARRAWVRCIVGAAGCAHRLPWLDVPDAACKQRLRARNATGPHAYRVSEAEFELFTDRFEPPSADQGLPVTVTGPGAADR